MEINNELLIYPNPTKSLFTIAFESTGISNIKVMVYNVLGKEIFSKDVANFSGQFKQQISLDDYVEGIYVVKITSDIGILSTSRISYIK